MNGPYVPVLVDEIHAILQLVDDAHSAGLLIDPAASYALQAIVDRASAGHCYGPTPMQHQQAYEYYEETIEYWEETTTIVEHHPHWSIGLGKALWRMVR